jgi:cell shape-determining protein MreC
MYIFFSLTCGQNYIGAYFFAMSRKNGVKRSRVLQTVFDQIKVAEAVATFCAHAEVQRAMNAALPAVVFDCALLNIAFESNDAIFWSGSLTGKRRDERSYGNAMFKEFANGVAETLSLNASQVATINKFRRRVIAPTHARNTKKKLVIKARSADTACAELVALQQELGTVKRENEVLRALLRSVSP